jgi:uncharacterized protein (TIGR02466 family)
MPPQSDKPHVLRLWPTLILRHRLPGAEAANPVLARVIEEMEAKDAQLTTNYLDISLFASDHPAVGWLRECINRAVIDYTRETAIDYELKWSIQGWANVNRFGDYHNLHNHPHAWLSGTYYVKVPEQPPADSPDLPGRNDRTPGAISFFDPRAQANMVAVKGDPQVEAEYRVMPQAGEILLWPAFLHHLVHPNLAKETRISVSFNIMLKWQDSYLP